MRQKLVHSEGEMSTALASSRLIADTGTGSVPFCQNLSQFLQFEKLYAQLEEVSTSSIENITNCLRPCRYKEYRMVNGPTASSETSTRFSSIFIFWFVSTETLVEEQSFVYPWQSLVFEITCLKENIK